MEETGKRMSALGTGMAMAVAVAVPGTTVGAKRKSGDMLDSDAVEVEEEERLNKIAKITKIADGEPPKAEAKDMQQRRPDDLSTGMRLQHRQPAPQLPIPPPPLPRYQELVTLVKDPPDFGGQEGMLDRLKRTVEGLGARVGKSLGKSLGGVAAVNALAEARAAAEARIAERNKDEGNKTSVANIAAVSTSKEEKILGSPSVIHSSGEARLSVSDLVTKLDVRGQETSKAFHIASPVHTSKTMTAGDESTSTTPPNSPPTLRASFKLPSGPVFRPPPVFVPPPSAPVINQQARTLTSVKDFSFNLPAPTFSKPTSPLGLGTRISPPSLPKPKQPFPLSTQSTLESITSERVFDTEEDVPAWMPMTQDTEYSFETQPLAQNGQYQRTHELDEDDSWPLGEKLSTDPVWVFGNANKEDSLTWSTLPTESQRAESGPVRTNGSLTEVESQNRGSLVVPGAFDKDVDREYGENYLALGESEIEEPEETGKITVSLVPFQPHVDLRY
jgi:hypothetical protein